MPTYRATRTPGGSYWVQRTDVVEEGMYAASAAGGLFLSAVAGMAGAAIRRRKDQQTAADISAMADAHDARNWMLLKFLAQQFVNKHGSGHDVLALALLQQHRFDEAIGETTKVPAEDKDDDFVLGIQAEAHRRAGRHETALERLSALTRSRNHDARSSAFAARASVLMTIGDLAFALTDADMVVTLSPAARGYCLRGDVHWARGDLQNAAADYGRALAIDGSHSESRDKLRSVLQELGDKDSLASLEQQASQYSEEAERTQAAEFIGRLRRRGYTVRPSDMDNFYCTPFLDVSSQSMLAANKSAIQAVLNLEADEQARLLVDYFELNGTPLRLHKNGRDIELTGTSAARTAETEEVRTLKPWVLKQLVDRPVT